MEAKAQACDVILDAFEPVTPEKMYRVLCAVSLAT